MAFTWVSGLQQPARAAEELDSLTKELLERSARNKEANEAAIINRAGSKQLPFQQSAPEKEAESSPRAKSIGVPLGGTTTVQVIAMKNGAVIELTEAEAEEMARIGLLTTSRVFGRKPEFLCLVERPPKNFFVVAKPPPAKVFLPSALGGGASKSEMDAQAAEEASLLASVKDKIDKSGAAPADWRIPVFSDELEAVPMCGKGLYRKPCKAGADLLSATYPELVLPDD